MCSNYCGSREKIDTVISQANDGDELAGVQGRFHVMVKPIGSTCNLNCTYCYYLSKEELLQIPGERRINDELLENFVKQYIKATSYNEVVFSWQGGEPTLLGIPFFEKVIELQKKHARPGMCIQNDLQTNGTLLNADWCAFLKENRFLVGLSVDGPKELHDKSRVDRGGAPTFDRTFSSALLLREYGVPFNTLTVVNMANAKHPLDVYRFLTEELGSTYIQLLPCVNYKGFETSAPGFWDARTLPVVNTMQSRPGNADSVVTEWSVDPEDYGRFLNVIFDCWYRRDLGKVLVNQFETIVAQHLGLGAQMCVYKDFCGKGVALEHDGSLYSCDHMVYPEYRLGNISERTLGQMAFGSEQRRFGFNKRESLPQYCRKCQYLSDCWGECPKNRCVRTPDGEVGLNYLCPGLKKFYAHVTPAINRIVADLKRQQSKSYPRLPGR